MAITDYLTAGEWAACYWIGQYEIHENDAPGGDLGLTLRAGIGRLAREGYVFRGIVGHHDGDYAKVAQQTDAPVSVLADMIAGRFRPDDQARLAIAWCRENAPAVDTAWLADALRQSTPAESPV